MKQLLDVLAFEFLGYAKKRSYVLTTLILAIGAALVIYAPRFQGVWQEVTGESPQAEQKPQVVAVFGAENTADPANTKELITQALNKYDVVYKDRAELESSMAGLSTGEISRVIEILGDTSYNVTAMSVGLQDKVQDGVSSALTVAYRESKLKELGVSSADAEEIFNVNIDVKEASLKGNSKDTFLTVYVSLFIIYMVISLYGSHVAVGISSEKSNRAVELLTTSANTNSLVFGKVFGIGLASILQVTIVFLIAGASYLFSKDYIDVDKGIGQMISVSPSVIVYLIMFLIGGFFVYAFTFAVAGAVAPKMEDINTISMPVIMVLLVSFVLSIIGIFGDGDRVNSAYMVILSYIPFTSPMAMFIRGATVMVLLVSFVLSIIGIFGDGDRVNSAYMVILSYIPFTSPMAMFIRGATGGASVIEVAISFSIILAFIVFEGVATARVYRAFILNYGSSSMKKVAAIALGKRKVAISFSIILAFIVFEGVATARVYRAFILNYGSSSMKKVAAIALGKRS